MEFALQVRGGYPELASAARWAEDRGLAALALPDHYLAGRLPGGEGFDTRSADIYPYLGALAATTRTLELSALVSPISYRHPAALLKLGLAVDEVSGGRFTLGVGTGWFRAEHETFGFPLPEWPERFDRLEEALGYLAAALGDGAAGFAGSFYQLEPVDHQPKGIRLRLMVGGSGPHRTPALAGRFADEFNIYSQTPERLRVRIQRAREAAEAAGRQPDALFVSCASQPVIGPDQATYEARLGTVASARGIEASELEQAARRIGAPTGTHEQAREAFGPLAGLGIERYYLQLPGGLGLDYAAELIEVLGSA